MTSRAHRWPALVGACILLLGSSNVIWAQEKFPINTTSEGQTSKYIQQYKVEVGDVPGHQVRIQETQRIYNERARSLSPA